MYLARRVTERTRRPSRRSANRSGSGKRRSGRASATCAMICPDKTGASPLQTVSTSGSSGIASGAGIAGEAGRADAGQRRDLVVVGGVARHADRAHHGFRRVEDQHAARHRDQRTDGVRHSGDEIGLLLRAREERAAAEAHGERAVRLADGDLGALQAGAVLRGDELQRAAIVEHGDGERLHAGRAARREGARDDLLGDVEFHGCDLSPDNAQTGRVN